MRPFKLLPTPVRYFSVSIAWRHPITPGVAPTTGNRAFSGGAGKRHWKHGVSGTWMKVSFPSSPQMLPCTKGIPFLTAHSLSTYRVGKLSMQSTMMSASPTSPSTVSASILVGAASTSMLGLSWVRLILADSALFTPMRESSCRICRFKLLNSGLSKSQMVMCPTPATAR